MDPKEKQKLLVLLAIFGIAGLVFYYNLLLKPQFSKFIVMNREFHAVKARMKSAETLIANELAIKKQYDVLKEQVTAMENRLPGQDQLSALLQDFSGVAESSRVKILKIKPLEVLDSTSQKGKDAFYYEFPILIEARAGYHQCGLFINKLENMDRFIRIDDIDIKGRSEDARQHDIKLRVSTYIAK